MPYTELWNDCNLRIPARRWPNTSRRFDGDTTSPCKSQCGGGAGSVDLDRPGDLRTARIGALDQLERPVVVRVSDRVYQDAVSVNVD
jgi:hypothetical protein